MGGVSPRGERGRLRPPARTDREVLLRLKNPTPFNEEGTDKVSIVNEKELPLLWHEKLGWAGPV